MHVDLPIKVEIRGRALSVYDRETIDRRLAVLKDQTDAAAEGERLFLQALKVELIPPGK